MTLLSHAHLLSVLSYDELSGNFVWLIDSGRARKGNIAGHVRADGYVYLGMFDTGEAAASAAGAKALELHGAFARRA